MRNRLFLLFSLLFITPCLLFANGKKISKIVLDAGHGGKASGAVGEFSKEKDVTLAVVLKLGKIMADSMKQVQVIYTRTTDAEPSLVDRHEIANQANADLFIAVHANSTPYTYTHTLSGYKTVKKGRKKVKKPIYTSVRHHVTTRSGVETYVLVLRRNGQKEEAIGEYSSSGDEASSLTDESDPQNAIKIAQYSQAFLNKSITLGTKIQAAFADQGRPDLGVKQMSLEVLAGTAMPGVLIEVGFINNPTEEAYMNSEKGQTEIAMAIFNGIKAYKEDIEK